MGKQGQEFASGQLKGEVGAHGCEQTLESETDGPQDVKIAVQIGFGVLLGF